ncbi:MAG: leucine--tRNA ligase [Candidatus Improbicoccus devescovinae]|nr:MAG: leucine--tRNA ligase [Candidatus Improbicoccus devescovinae]
MKIEQKWREYREKINNFSATEDFTKPKYYVLIEFPYPSGQGLHVGHTRSNVAMDVVARKRRMQGFNVLYPIGWDSFGLPAENYAIKNNIHPKVVTEQNIQNFKSQLKFLGISFDWNREINTTNVDYYKWTQWIFSRLFENGLAAKKNTRVNWCTSCKCVLANEEVISGKCERCSHTVIQKEKSQWILKIANYAQRLLDDLNLVDYPKRVRIQQENWIGKSQGAAIKFKISPEISCDIYLEVFTTRPETIFGVTYLVIAPENNIINTYNSKIKNIQDIYKYREESLRKNDFERAEIAKEKTGIEIKGLFAINPVNNDHIPIFIADYVLSEYGTGAVMAVPAHDERDWQFAQKYNINIKKVVENTQKSGIVNDEVYTGDGVLINSEFLDGLSIENARSCIIKKLQELNAGDFKINYKLKDWIFSRQRYWGEPIPIIDCPHCGHVLDENLPVELPDINNFKPLETGESILQSLPWSNVLCPKCGLPSKRETDTMPQWAGSSWYFLRYLDPENAKNFADMKKINYWMPVDWYNGGMEHTTLHLLYSRFWHKFLYDIGAVSTPEPYAKRTSHGLILSENGEKMSKSRENVIDPTDIVKKYGADAFRLYILFIGDFEQAVLWNSGSILGCVRFIEKIFGLTKILVKTNKIRDNISKILNITTKKVSEDIENLKFNTAISAMMTFVNDIKNTGEITLGELDIFTKLLGPFAPFLVDEIREITGLKDIISEFWPDYNSELINSGNINIVLQINGKIKSTISVDPNTTKEDIIKLAESNEKISKIINGQNIQKKIYISKKIVNFVINF